VFGALLTAEDSPPGVLQEVARAFSPRIEVWSQSEIVLDLSGLERLFGDARTIAEELRHTAADRGLRVRVAMTGTRTAARLLVRYRAGLTIVEPGNEAAAVAPLPITLLNDLLSDSNHPQTSNPRNPDPGSRVPDQIATFRRWGLRTLGDLAALPPDDLAARLGHQGTDLQRLACGEDSHPLVPAVPEERFEQSLDLEWPIEELEPLSFVLGRLMDRLEAHLEQCDRGAAVLHVRLHLIKTDGTTRQIHERSLQLPVAIRDARTLRTLALLDLESNPPPAAIDRVTVAVDPTPGRIVQFSLLTRPLPSPEQISTLMARLHALMGETRCGSPVMVDSWEPGAFAMKSFMPLDVSARHPNYDPQRHRDPEGKISHAVRDDLSGSVPPPSRGVVGPRSGEASPPLALPCSRAEAGRCVVEVNDASKSPVVALRRFRHPIPVRVQMTHGQPTSVSIMRRGLSSGVVESCAGPWRTSGGWWTFGIRDSRLGIRELGIQELGTREPATLNSRIPDPGSRVPGPWDRDEWDVSLTSGPTYRLFRERHSDKWFLEGVVD
jgi:impB/mucB/samB family protein